MPSATAPAARLTMACTNCGAAFVPERRAFCPECGQETQIRPPRIGEFIQQFGGAYLSTEGALWRTLKLLLTQPGELTRQYLAGRRRHYVLPLRLYLTITVLALLLLRGLGAIDLVRGIDDAERRAAASGTQAAPASAIVRAWPLALGLHEGRFICEGMPRQVCELIQRRAVPDTATFLQRARLANQRVSANAGPLMVVLLPLFALLSWAVFHRGRLHYTEHLVFALHLHAFWTLALTLASLAGSPLDLLCALGALVYLLLSCQKVHGGPAWRTGLLALLLLLLYLGLMLPAQAAAWLLALIA